MGETYQLPFRSKVGTALSNFSKSGCFYLSKIII